jgi:hypothetical protein
MPKSLTLLRPDLAIDGNKFKTERSAPPHTAARSRAPYGGEFLGYRDGANRNFH